MKNGYQIYTQQTAPAEAQPVLTEVQQNLQFLPNALGAMAESPKLLKGYLQLGELVQQGSFSDVERHILYLTVSREYDSCYCVAAHTVFAHMDKVPETIVQQMRAGEPLSDPKLEALRQFAIKLVQTGCNVTEQDVQAFLDQGYTRSQILEMVLLITNKLMAAFSLRIMDVDLDEALKPTQWTKVA